VSVRESTSGEGRCRLRRPGGARGRRRGGRGRPRRAQPEQHRGGGGPGRARVRRVDVLVNAAGVIRSQPLLETTIVEARSIGASSTPRSACSRSTTRSAWSRLPPRLWNPFRSRGSSACGVDREQRQAIPPAAAVASYITRDLPPWAEALTSMRRSMQVAVLLATSRPLRSKTRPSTWARPWPV